MKIYYLKPPPSYMPYGYTTNYSPSWFLDTTAFHPSPHPALPQIGRFWQARPYGDWGVSWWVSMVSGRKSPCMLKVGQSIGWRLKAGQLMGWWLMFFSFWSSIVLFLRQKGLILKYLKCSLIVHHSKDRCQAFFFSISLSRLTGPIFGVTVVF